MLPIVFYFPYSSVGGVSILFLRLAEYIAKEREVFIMDLEDGYMAKHLPEYCKFIPYDKPELLPDESIVIIQSCPLWRIPFIKKFHNKTKILFWNLHPNNFKPTLISSNPSKKYLKPFSALINKFSYPRYKKLKKMVRLLEKKKSLVFMDKENADSTSEILKLPGLQRNYVPIMTSDINSDISVKTPKDILKCVWVGRLDDFKIPILLHTIKRLDEIVSMPLSFSIIGSGPLERSIIDAIEKCKNIKVDMLGTVEHAELDGVLVEYDIIFAMGTSALEGAKLGIPTICLDYSFAPLTGIYKYRMLYNCINYNVAEEINESHYELESTLEKILLNIKTDYFNISNHSYRYWEDNFSPKNGMKIFLQHVDIAECTIQELVNKQYSKPDVITRLVSKIVGDHSAESGFIYL